MKHKLSEIINTDCYVQFDTNEQLREWVKKHIKTQGTKMEFSGFCDTWLSVYSDGLVFFSDDKYRPSIPVYHHTNISI